MPTLFCCILNCETESVNSKKRKIFYRLPQNVDRKQLWLSQIGDRIKYGTVSANSRICNAHFATGKPNLDSSHIDHVPTIFPWSSKDDKAKSLQAVEQYQAKIKDLEQKILAKAFMTASSEAKISPDVEVTNFEVQDYSKLEVATEEKQKLCLSKIKTEQTVIEDTSPGVSHPDMTNRAPPSDGDNRFSLNHNLLNYLISSLSQVNMVTKTEPEIERSHRVEILSPSGHTCPLNLSQSYNKIEEVSTVKDATKPDISQGSLQVTPSQSLNTIDQNGETYAIQTVKNNPSLIPTITTPNVPLTEETNCRSCTCTKSSCLKLYCECFASGNLCSSGCTCFNCRNNNNFKEERDKIVNSYLERDPWVFSSKIDNQEVGKKHTKGCNCLKSSCLKNYCECFENKVFCSNLCRCRLCYNNEDHSHQNHQREDTKVYQASHTSDSISIISENSPRDIGRKRKKSIIKTNGIYEDVTSNKYVQESGEELAIKRRQLEADVTTTNTESNRSINSMDIPPTLPQEDDFTEEELALMLKIREQRSVKLESISPPVESPRSQSTPLNFTSSSNGSSVNASITSPSLNTSTQIESNLLMSISKSLAVNNMGLSGVSFINNHQEPSRLSSNDLLNMLVSQQLMVSRQSTLSPNYSHVIPINLAQVPSSQNLIPQPSCPPPIVATSSRPITTTIQSPINVSQSKNKLSTEDYVRRHIEAAERAVRADNMRRDCIGSRKALQKQKIKIEPMGSPEKRSPTLNDRPLFSNQSASLSKQQSEEFEIQNGNNVTLRSNGYISDAGTCATSSHFIKNNPPLLDIFSTVQSNCSPAFTKAVQLMHRSSHKLAENQSMAISKSHSKSINSGRKWRDKYKSLRRSLHNMRTELRSIKVHMRADQSKIRRLENILLHMSNELHN